METWTLKRRPSWMHVADPRILLAVRHRDDPVGVRDLRREQPYPYLYLLQRCERLVAEGLLQPLPDDRYELRELGRAFLNGEVPVAELESHPLGGSHLTA
jgi:hypothetical protein